ncbi:MAG: coenzyme F420-0:L-glutamate ligase [Tissierellia bacterium]|nr:coenzyme F420-0:L-glutamate ligase [Tissierellia bacterium]
MVRLIGTSAYGIRAPIVKEGDHLEEIVVDSVLNAVEGNGLTIREMDVVAVTESLVARAQGNYCDVRAITSDLNAKYEDSIGVLFPITSRNRFSVILRAIAETKKRIILFLSYPSDEVGNRIMDVDLITKHNINIYNDTLSEADYRRLVGEEYLHPFTGVDYVSLYKSYAIGDNIEIYLSNDPLAILEHTQEVLIANIHDRSNLKELLKKHGAKTVYALDDIMTKPIDGSGYNPKYGLYGSNLSKEDSLKLFPRDAEGFVEKVQQLILERTGTEIQVMVYGDGAFKDPVGHIWELADPVVSPAFTSKLDGRPNELKLKYIADNDLASMEGTDAEAAMRDKILHKKQSDEAGMEVLGTTPRQIPDLLGSLADLISGSGDKGTPIVLIQGYFDNYASE